MTQHPQYLTLYFRDPQEATDARKVKHLAKHLGYVNIMGPTKGEGNIAEFLAALGRGEWVVQRREEER